MSQDLAKLSPEALQLQLPMFTIGRLKQFMQELAEYRRRFGKVMTDAELQSTLRKETKIQKELIRRGFIKSKQDKQQFNDWQKNLDTNLKKWR